MLEEKTGGEAGLVEGPSCDGCSTVELPAPVKGKGRNRTDNLPFMVTKYLPASLPQAGVN